ncbi:MAG TPA: Uma2 family endonuclease [Blastocatellia bacterium]|nr:Uma2 family endonuclease [Blastocatellia bacterium]
MMTTTSTLMTEEELMRLPDNGHRYELVKGELRETPPTGFDHGRTTYNLSLEIGSHVRRHRLGDMLAAETGFIIDRSQEGRVTVRAADIAFVAKGRIPPGTDTSKYLELAPDLVVETLSPSDTAVEIEEKIFDWLNAGVRVALTVNPARRSVTVYRSLTDIKNLTDQDELNLRDVIPGFCCKVSAIFD